MERSDALSEILDNLNIELSNSQIKQLSEDFSLHIEMESEIESYQHIGGSDKCEECDKLKREIAGLNYELDCFKDGVKKRHPLASHVYVENGDVKFDIN